MMTLTRDKLESVIDNIKVMSDYPWHHKLNFILENDQAQRAVIARYREKVDEQAVDIIDHIDEKHKLNKQTEQQAKEIGELRERIDRQATTITEYQAENETLREALRNIIECEDQWTRHDMVREAKHALKEVTT